MVLTEDDEEPALFGRLTGAVRRVLRPAAREVLLQKARDRSMTPAKRRNEQLNEEEYRQQRLRLNSSPPTVILGLTNACNLRCPLCVTGLGLHEKKRGFMAYSDAEAIINRIGDTAVWVWLHNWGESLLHKDFVPILRLAKAKGLAVQLSTNFAMSCSDEVLAALVDSPLDQLTVSFDGLTQETYSAYRRGGDLDTVVDNVRSLVALKRERKSHYPVVDLQFLVNRHNAHEVGRLEEYRRTIGADHAFTTETVLPFKSRDEELARAWLTDEDIASRPYLDVDLWVLSRTCPFLYKLMVVEQDGSVPPCCYATDPNDDFAVFDESALPREVFNSKKFIRARALFRDDAAGSEPGAGSEPLVCATCSVLRSYRGEPRP